MADPKGREPKSGMAELEGRLAGERFHADFRDRMTYGDYLQLDKVLNAQTTVTGTHDEMLFITIHQAKELWMKLMIHELEAALPLVRAGGLRPAFKMFARVKRIFDNLIQSWAILNTMTPADYMRFRDGLGTSSGFQSFQYRSIEFILGNKNRATMKVHAHRSDIMARLTALLERPSIYDEAVILLAKRGFKIDKACTERDWSQMREPNESVIAAWRHVYQDTEKHWDVYELAESLMDIDDLFQTWRFRHANTVERVIGNKPGTGGTSGAAYLRKAIATRLFEELWAVRTGL
ncbi:MAG TPA: tryptophan 2,3-dioxygenase family protein [Alphaproteobacteria bacterium]